MPRRLITSQDDTAPKRSRRSAKRDACLITSQDDTAPKLASGEVRRPPGLITSQDDTAPKPLHLGFDEVEA